MQNAIQWATHPKMSQGRVFHKGLESPNFDCTHGESEVQGDKSFGHGFNIYPHSYPAGRALCCARGSLGGRKDAEPVQPLPCLGTSMRGSMGKDRDSVKETYSFSQGHHSAKFWACLCQTLPMARDTQRAVWSRPS